MHLNGIKLHEIPGRSEQDGLELVLQPQLLLLLELLVAACTLAENKYVCNESHMAQFNRNCCLSLKYAFIIKDIILK